MADFLTSLYIPSVSRTRGKNSRQDVCLGHWKMWIERAPITHKLVGWMPSSSTHNPPVHNCINIPHQTCIFKCNCRGLTFPCQFHTLHCIYSAECEIKTEKNNLCCNWCVEFMLKDYISPIRISLSVFNIYQRVEGQQASLQCTDKLIYHSSLRVTSFELKGQKISDNGQL